MEFVFRKWTAETVLPAAGEILIRGSDDTQPGRFALALQVLKYGLKGLRQGAGAPQRFVLDADPTFDDLLAATLADRLLAGQTLPAGCKPFAHYAALAREGLKPSKLPLEQSLEGMFLAIRNVNGSDLTEPAVAEAFLAQWQRLAEVIFAAAEAGKDPFTTPLLAEVAELSRERNFLTHDQLVFEQDRSRGDEWVMRFPGGPPLSYGLLLRDPHSLLFKFWSRQPQPQCLQQPYLFLVVVREGRKWILSTDPIYHLSLQKLVDVLQAAERRKDADRAAADPWFDGKRFQHTLIASPHQGTLLAEPEVLQLVQKWARAQLKTPRKPARPAIVLTCVLSVLLLAGVLSPFWPPAPPPSDRPEPTARPVAWEFPNPAPGDGAATLYLLAVGVSRYADPTIPRLEYADDDARDLIAAFQTHSRGLFSAVKVLPEKGPLLDEQATHDNITAALGHLAEQELDKNDLVVVLMSGHGACLHDNHRGFFFLTHDCARHNVHGRALPFAALVGAYLSRLPCKVFLVLDTCHSGSSMGDLDHQSAIEGGMIVLTACLKDQTAMEKDGWKHGLLSLALLEGLSGRHLCLTGKATPLPQPLEGKSAINLDQMIEYAKHRAADLAGDRQIVDYRNRGEITPARIYLAQRTPLTAAWK